MAKKQINIKKEIQQHDDEILIMQVALRAIQKMKEERNNKKERRILVDLNEKLKNI